MQLSNFIRRVIFSTAFISTFLVFSISIIFQYINFENDKIHIREEFTQIKKEQIKREVLSVYNLIEQKEEILINSVKEKLRERVAQANNLAMSIYNQNKDTKNPEEIKLLIAKAINNLSYQNDKTYFFINSNKGQAIIFNKNNFMIFKLSICKFKNFFKGIIDIKSCHIFVSSKKASKIFNGIR